MGYFGPRVDGGQAARRVVALPWRRGGMLRYLVERRARGLGTVRRVGPTRAGAVPAGRYERAHRPVSLLTRGRRPGCRPGYPYAVPTSEGAPPSRRPADGGARARRRRRRGGARRRP